MNTMELEHVALCTNSEKESDQFFIDLLQLKKTRSFTISSELTERFFGIKKEQPIVRYSEENVDIEVFITNDGSQAPNIFSHVCLSTGNQEQLLEKAKSMGYSTIKVPRKEGESYYCFIKDKFGNLYEIK